MTRFVLVAALTAAMYLILYALAAKRIDPVVWVAPLPAETMYRQHGKPVLDVTGIIVFAAVIFVYAAGVGAAAAPTPARARAIVLTALASLVIVAVVHPAFMPLLLPAGWRSEYAQFFESTGLPFGAARANWSPAILLTVVAIPHALITTFLTRK